MIIHRNYCLYLYLKYIILDVLLPEFTDQAVPESVGRSVGIVASVQDPTDEFVGFTYVPPTHLEAPENDAH